MSSFLKYSFLNPIRFWQFGKNDLWTMEIPLFEWQRDYYLKFRESDEICFQLLCKDSTLDIYCKVYDVKTGELFCDSNISPLLPYDDYYLVYQWRNFLPIHKTGITEPTLIQIYLTIPSPSDTCYLRSEYIMIYPDSYSDKLIDDTITIRCFNNENDFDYLFIDNDGNETGDILIRVEGGFKSAGFLPVDNQQMYLDLQEKPNILQTIPDNVHRLTIGSEFVVPIWIVDKLNRYFGLTNVKIDGVQYCRHGGARLEPLNHDPYHCSEWTIDLLKSKNYS
jgi:hypothetical protein